MDAALEHLDRQIMTALEHLDYLRGTHYERYAAELLENLVCKRERYVKYLSMLN